MLTQQEKAFIIQNKEILSQIATKYLEFYKDLIWREKDLVKKQENSAVADRIYDLLITIKDLRMETTKPPEKFTGV